jgi:hypothetical protein
MNHRPNIDRFLASIPPISTAQGTEIALAYLNVKLRDVSTDTLRMFRAYWLAMYQGTPDQTVVLDVVDEQLALRETGGA